MKALVGPRSIVLRDEPDPSRETARRGAVAAAKIVLRP